MVEGRASALNRSEPGVAVRGGFPRGADRNRRRLLLVTAAAGGVVIVGLYLLAVRTGIGQHADDAAVRHQNLERLADADLTVADGLLVAALAAQGLILAWCGRHRRALVLAVGAATLASVVGARLLKALLGRPELGPPGVGGGPFDPLYGPSFPSGHAAAAMTLALGAALVAPTRRWAPMIGATGPSVVAGIALAIPIHRPSDLVAGFVIGVVAMTVVVAVTGARPSGDDAARMWGRPAWLGWALLLAGAVVLSEAVVLRRVDLSLSDLGPSYLGAVCLLVACAHGSAWIFTWVSGRSPTPKVVPDDGPVRRR